jgi:hypothetical protein
MVGKEQITNSSQKENCGEDINEKKLNIDDFELSFESNKKSQDLFYFAMTKLIDIYNENKDKSKNIGIYVRKGKNLILASITEEIVDQFLNAKILLNNLIIGKTRFYSEYDPYYKTNTKSNDKN